MLLDLLVDTVVPTSLDGEDHVPGVGVREGHVLTIPSVSGSGEADGGDSILQLPRHVKDVLS